jgi:hypothetical protein
MAEVSLFVPSAEFAENLDTRVVEIWSFDLARSCDAVKGQQVMAGQKIGDICGRKHNATPGKARGQKALGHGFF